MTPPRDDDQHDDLGGLTAAQAEREIYAHIIARAPENQIEPTLDRIRAACELMGDPQRAYRVIHVAGTNGKTSTARMAESLVRSHGLRTGLFTSPHLSSVRERIVIDGEPIAPADFVRLWREVAPIVHLVDVRSQAAGGPQMSFFEVLTALAFAAFADAPVDVAVIEVGLGGGWDATNVADGEVAVIAPVSLDHVEYLGTDLAGIGREKAGIIKAGAVVVSAAQSEAVEPVIAAAAHATGASLLREGDDIEVEHRMPGVGGQLVTLRTPAATYADLFVPLLGAHQAGNALLALTAVEALLADGGQPAALNGEVVEQGFAAVLSPGRLEVVRTSPLIVVDAAHNPAGAAALAEALDESFAVESLVAVIGVLADKDAEGILAALEPVVDEVVVTASASPRALPVEHLAVVARGVFGDDRVHMADDLPDALDRAVQISEGSADRAGGVLVTGSITLVAEARLLLGSARARLIDGRGKK